MLWELQMTMSNKSLTLIFLFIFASALSGADMQVVVKGGWGKNSDQLGIKFLAPGVLPTAPFMGVGGYEVDDEGRIFFSDSVNRQIKSYFKKEWRETFSNAEGLGEVCLFSGKLYVISRKPDGFIIFDTSAEKIEKMVKVPFKSPGRIAVANKNLVLIEELSGGLWLIENDKPRLHPAVALQACGNAEAVFGLQKDLLSENLQIIRAEISKEFQEPEVTNIVEVSVRKVFARLVGMFGNSPILATVAADQPEKIEFQRLDDPGLTISLPVLEGPYLMSSWKLCSDGQFYGFSGTASAGFQIIRSGKNFRP